MGIVMTDGPNGIKIIRASGEWDPHIIDTSERCALHV
jgi:hypothetical protein